AGHTRQGDARKMAASRLVARHGPLTRTRMLDTGSALAPAAFVRIHETAVAAPKAWSKRCLGAPLRAPPGRSTRGIRVRALLLPLENMSTRSCVDCYLFQRKL